jgi:hypothetical protein
MNAERPALLDVILVHGSLPKSPPPTATQVSSEGDLRAVN